MQIFTSVKQDMFYPVFACPFVCLVASSYDKKLTYRWQTAWRV